MILYIRTPKIIKTQNFFIEKILLWPFFQMIQFAKKIVKFEKKLIFQILKWHLETHETLSYIGFFKTINRGDFSFFGYFGSFLVLESNASYRNVFSIFFLAHCFHNVKQQKSIRVTTFDPPIIWIIVVIFVSFGKMAGGEFFQ